MNTISKQKIIPSYIVYTNQVGRTSFLNYFTRLKLQLIKKTLLHVVHIVKQIRETRKNIVLPVCTCAGIVTTALKSAPLDARPPNLARSCTDMVLPVASSSSTWLTDVRLDAAVTVTCIVVLSPADSKVICKVNKELILIFNLWRNNILYVDLTN